MNTIYIIFILIKNLYIHTHTHTHTHTYIANCNKIYACKITQTCYFPKCIIESINITRDEYVLQYISAGAYSGKFLGGLIIVLKNKFLPSTLFILQKKLGK